MDEQYKNTLPNESVPSGFDSVTPTTPSTEGVFHPSPMFAKHRQNHSIESAEEKHLPQTPTDDSHPPVESSRSSFESDHVVSATESTPNTNDTPVFIPSGTYSYSAAKGDLQSSAFETPDTQPKADIPPVFSPEPPKYQSPPTPQPKDANPPKKKYGVGIVLVAALLSAVLGLSGGLVGSLVLGDRLGLSATSSTEETPKTEITTNILVDETVNSSIEAVAKKAGPSIIGIRTTAAVSNFFGGSSETTEEGSGIIYSADGYIITNYHVIQSAVESSSSKVEIFLPEDTNTAITASVVGYNIASDLAVVKINKTGLPAITFANSDKLKIGQYAIAIGNPGGLEFIGSVSYGVISGLNRSVAIGTGATMSLIQTDAAINPGNSGGALVDIQGNLIGVNSIKLVSESYEGMGFAIPANTVKEICDNIIAKQNDPTPYIGIQISQSYTAAQLKALGYPEGAVVVNVMEGGPAAEGGIQRGDIITEFNGKAIQNYTDLDAAIADSKPGNSVTVKLYRAGRFYSTNISVQANNAQ